jgi:toxin FitB
MIVLDTNVISGMFRPAPDMSLQHWFANTRSQSLFLSTVTLAELGFGIAILERGRKRSVLTEQVSRTRALFRERILDFDTAAADAYAMIAANARRIGRPLPVADGYIAAIASVRGFAVATRDEAPFRAAGVAVINPWAEAGR